MSTFRTFEDIEVWRKARALCNKVFVIAKNTDLNKDYRLKDQINASSGSIMDNIAEGFGRGGNQEFIQFLEIAHASCCECQSQLYRILDRQYISDELFQELFQQCLEIRKMIISLVNYLKNSPYKGIKFKKTAP